jgi:hypothetical protein
MQSNRCVYSYVRATDDIGGKAGTPYYIGKGTIRRAYDWMRHTRVILPDDAHNIHILASNMSDIDAMQAEILLIYLYGRRDYKYKRFGWERGILLNKTEGGDGPAHPDYSDAAIYADARFHDKNINFKLLHNAEGQYWYSPFYPSILNSSGAWTRKEDPDRKKVRKMQPNDKSTYVPALTPIQIERLARIGQPVCDANAWYDAERNRPMAA